MVSSSDGTSGPATISLSFPSAQLDSSSDSGSSDDDRLTPDKEDRLGKYPLPGSVMAAYLSDPVVNPAARSLFLPPQDSPRPRAADFVNNLRVPPLKSHLSDGSTTSTFINIINDMHGMYEEAPCCPVDVQTIITGRRLEGGHIGALRGSYSARLV